MAQEFATPVPGVAASASPGFEKPPPTLKTAALVGCCPGCGPCISDYIFAAPKTEDEKNKMRLGQINLSDMKGSVEKIRKFFGNARENPDNGVAFSTPVQFVMGAKGEGEAPAATDGNVEGKRLSWTRNPDILCTCNPGRCSMFPVVLMIAASIYAAKQVLLMYTVVLIAMSLGLTLFMQCLHFCGIKCGGESSSPYLHRVVMNVVEMKSTDKQLEKAQKTKMEFKARVAWEQFKSLFQAIFCCRMFRPHVLFTFAKTLMGLVITDIFMTGSIWIYIAARVLCGSVTWTVCSTAGWVQELLNSMALKERITFFNYAEWKVADAHLKGQNPEVESPEIPGIPGCCGAYCSCCSPACGGCYEMCCSLPCCKLCFCDLGCVLCEPCCGTFCELALEFAGDFSSVMLLIGKAMWYTDRQTSNGHWFLGEAAGGGKPTDAEADGGNQV